MVWFEDGWDRRRLRGQFTWFVAWVIITVIGAIILRPDPAGHGTHQQLGLPPCPSVVFFGRPCPGCGLTTSWTSVLHGQITQSIEAHPLGAFLYLLFTASALACGYGYWKQRRFVSDSKGANAFMFGVAVAVLGYGAWRFATVPYETNAGLIEQLADVNREMSK